MKKSTKQKIRNAFTGLAAVVAGTFIGGCYQQSYNEEPQITLAQKDGTLIRATDGLNEYNGKKYDEVFLLPIARGDLEKGLDFLVTASDTDGPQPLQANYFPDPTTPLAVTINGTNKSGNVSWQTTISGTGVQLGTYRIAEITASDGVYTTNAAIIASIFEGPSVNEVTNMETNVNEIQNEVNKQPGGGEGRQQQTPIEQLLSEPFIQVANADGTPYPRLKENTGPYVVNQQPKAYVRFYIPTELEQRINQNNQGKNIPIPSSVRVEQEGFTGPDICFTVSSNGAISRLGETLVNNINFTIYQTEIDFNRSRGCPETNEQAGIIFGLNAFGEGEIPYADAAFTTIKD